MKPPLSIDSTHARPLHLVTGKDLEGFVASQTPSVQSWIRDHLSSNKPGQHCILPGDKGIQGVVAIVDENHYRSVGRFAKALPKGTYKIQGSPSKSLIADAALAWSRALYRFDKHREIKRELPTLAMDESDRSIMTLAESAYLVRDWVNAPAGEFGPTAFADAASAIAYHHGATVRIVEGKALQRDYPMIHAVGRAAVDQPRLIDIVWGDPNAPKLTIVGKGVCFDTGGINLKPSQYMRNMKKDMGGGAHALGLANLIMAQKLPIRLRCLIPAVENAVAGDAYRPGDILKSRSGVTVEIHNTDAEGRLVLADALTDAVSESPELLLDFATLTGAARVALGPDLPALFSHDDALANGLIESCKEAGEPVWRMPLHADYRSFLDSSVADISNAAKTPKAGCITAALFLERFAKDAPSWAHMDLYAWNDSGSSIKPAGGEAQCLRGIMNYLERRFSKTAS